MSILFSEHIVGARTRHGAHYKLVKGKPGMVMHRDRESMPYEKDELICTNCWWTPFDKETTKCKRCGHEL